MRSSICGWSKPFDTAFTDVVRAITPAAGAAANQRRNRGSEAVAGGEVALDCGGGERRHDSPRVMQAEYNSPISRNNSKRRSKMRKRLQLRLPLRFRDKARIGLRLRREVLWEGFVRPRPLN